MKVLCVDTLATRLDILLADISFRKEVKSHQFWSIRHNPGESMKKLSEFLISENIPLDKLALALPGSLCSYHYFTVPFKKNKELRDNVPFEIEDRVPFDPDNIYQAFQVLEKGKIHSEILATIIPKDLYHKFIDQIREHRLEPEVICPGPVAMAYSLLPIAQNHSGPIMAIEIRDITTYIVVVNGPSVIVCRAYPMGLNHFVNPLAKYKNISQDEAYAELKRVGPQFPPGQIPDDLRDIIKPFFVEIKKTIMYIRSQGHNYISNTYLSGYGREWVSFEELLAHEFQIPVDRNLLSDKYAGKEDIPSLITHGLLLHFTSRKASNLINLRVHEHRAKQSIEELIKKFDSPEIKSLVRYSFATVTLLFFYFVLMNIFLGIQRDKLESKLMLTIKDAKNIKVASEIPSPSKNTVISKADGTRKVMVDIIKKQQMEVDVLENSTFPSQLDILSKFVSRAPRDLQSDIISLSLKDNYLEIQGQTFNGEIGDYKKRLEMRAAGEKAIEKFTVKDSSFTLGVRYE